MSLARRTPLRAKPRSKGNRGELAVIDLLGVFGWNARRNWQSGGQGGGDIINGPAGVHLEVKHRERCAIWEWIGQVESEARPTDLPMVVCRRNLMQWWSVMPSDEWEALYALLPQRGTYTVVRKDRQRCPLWTWIKEAESSVALLGSVAVPCVVFSRPGSGLYSAVPAASAFEALWLRETA